jgi:hypothetical protein
MIDSRFIPDVPSSDPPVTHRPEAHRFENLTDGHLSFATYQLDRSARQVVFDHTLVPPQLQGRGIAAALISTAQGCRWCPPAPMWPSTCAATRKPSRC